MKNYGEGMKGARYAYKQSIRILRKYHVGWPEGVQSTWPTTPAITTQTEPPNAELTDPKGSVK